MPNVDNVTNAVMQALENTGIRNAEIEIKPDDELTVIEFTYTNLDVDYEGVDLSLNNMRSSVFEPFAISSWVKDELQSFETGYYSVSATSNFYDASEKQQINWMDYDSNSVWFSTTISVAFNEWEWDASNPDEWLEIVKEWLYQLGQSNTGAFHDAEVAVELPKRNYEGVLILDVGSTVKWLINVTVFTKSVATEDPTYYGKHVVSVAPYKNSYAIDARTELELAENKLDSRDYFVDMARRAAVISDTTASEIKKVLYNNRQKH